MNEEYIEGEVAVNHYTTMCSPVLAQTNQTMQTERNRGSIVSHLIRRITPKVDASSSLSISPKSRTIFELTEEDPTGIEVANLVADLDMEQRLGLKSERSSERREATVEAFLCRRPR